MTAVASKNACVVILCSKWRGNDRQQPTCVLARNGNMVSFYQSMRVLHRLCHGAPLLLRGDKNGDDVRQPGLLPLGGKEPKTVTRSFSLLSGKSSIPSCGWEGRNELVMLILSFANRRTLKFDCLLRSGSVETFLTKDCGCRGAVSWIPCSSKQRTCSAG